MHGLVFGKTTVIALEEKTCWHELIRIYCRESFYNPHRRYILARMIGWLCKGAKYAP